VGGKIAAAGRWRAPKSRFHTLRLRAGPEILGPGELLREKRRADQFPSRSTRLPFAGHGNASGAIAGDRERIEQAGDDVQTRVCRIDWVMSLIMDVSFQVRRYRRSGCQVERHEQQVDELE